MKIAQVAPLMERVPPLLYGGTERVVSYLTEELVALGHDVTLFASGDSITTAQLASACPEALRLSKERADPVASHAYQLELVASRAHEFDIIHFHTDWGHMPVFSRLNAPFLTTLHGRLDLASVGALLRHAAQAPVVSVSNAQRRPVPYAHWLGTVYHGLPVDVLRLQTEPGQYLAFLGRMCAEKGPEMAIRVARRMNLPIRLAAKVDKTDQDYFDTVIRPLLNQPGVEFVGEIGEHEKASFLGNATAVLFPIDWPEPFGMVMIEAMACGTPVIAMRRGSVEEIVRNGVNGYVVDSELEFLAAIDKAGGCTRAGVRADFERRFASSRMARDYVRLYEAVAVTHEAAPGLTRAASIPRHPMKDWRGLRTRQPRLEPIAAPDR